MKWRGKEVEMTCIVKIFKKKSGKYNKYLIVFYTCYEYKD